MCFRAAPGVGGAADLKPSLNLFVKVSINLKEAAHTVVLLGNRRATALRFEFVESDIGTPRLHLREQVVHLVARKLYAAFEKE